MPVRACTLLALIVLAACRGSDPQPLEFVWGDDVWAEVIAGGGSSDVIAYSRWNGYAGSHGLRFVRHDAARPDDLQLVGEIDDVGTAQLGCLFVSGTVAVFCANGAWVVDLASGTLPTRELPLSRYPQALAAAGGWLLAASESTLTLVDLAQPSMAVVASGVTSAPFTAVLATNGLFFAFTTAGYVRVTPDAVEPVFEEVQDASMRNFRAAYPDGVQAIVAGPSTMVGRSRVARLEFVAPAQGAPLAPVLVREHEVPAPFAAFAWDGATTSIVAIEGGGVGGEVHEGYVVHEAAGTFTSAGIPLPQYFGSANPIAAHADRLFAISVSGMGMYRITR